MRKIFIDTVLFSLLMLFANIFLTGKINFTGLAVGTAVFFIFMVLAELIRKNM